MNMCCNIDIWAINPPLTHIFYLSHACYVNNLQRCGIFLRHSTLFVMIWSICKYHTKEEGKTCKKIIVFNKYLCVIWNKGILSKDKSCKSLAMTLAFVSKQIWIRPFKWGTREPCRLKNYKVMNPQSSPQLRIKTGPQKGISILTLSKLK